MNKLPRKVRNQGSHTLFSYLACESAIRFDRCSYKFIEHAIQSKCLGILQASRDEDIISPPEHENIRGLFE